MFQNGNPLDGLSRFRISTKAEDLTTFGHDWGGLVEPKPCAVAFPTSTLEVSEILKYCNEHNISVVPSGGRTGLSGGASATNGELVLSLSKMNKIIDVSPGLRTARVQAGVITETLHLHLAELDLTWPIDFAAKGSSQIGGNIATNAGGVRVIHYGSTRNWVLSLQVVTATGEILEFNNDLEKNNSGYDLRHLMIGSEGTLGVITEATLKLAPILHDVDVGLFALDDMEAVVQLYKAARQSRLNLTAFECFTKKCYNSALSLLSLPSPIEQKFLELFVLIESVRSDEFSTFVEKAFESGLIRDGVIAKSPREGKELWKIREAVPESILTNNTVLQHDISVPIAVLPEFSRIVTMQYNADYPEFDVFIFGHIGDGNLHIFIQKPQTMDSKEFLIKCKGADDKLFALIQKFHGSVSAEHGVGLLKKHALNFCRSSAEIELLKRIKKAFDPKSILNPGKIF